MLHNNILITIVELIIYEKGSFLESSTTEGMWFPNIWDRVYFRLKSTRMVDMWFDWVKLKKIKIKKTSTRILGIWFGWGKLSKRLFFAKSCCTIDTIFHFSQSIHTQLVSFPFPFHFTSLLRECSFICINKCDSLT